MTTTFLSTPSARRATGWMQESRYRSSISIHALREEGDTGSVIVGTPEGISIHALREEGDRQKALIRFALKQFLSTPAARRATLEVSGTKPQDIRFLSTPSARRATHRKRRRHQRGCISIHALREEGDVMPWTKSWTRFYFYPRPPRGGRPRGGPCSSRPADISIHALREEGDLWNIHYHR